MRKFQIFIVSPVKICKQCKLLLLLGRGFVARLPTGASRKSPGPLGYTPKWKFLGAATYNITYLILLLYLAK